jgi:hypothetical protein
MTRRNLPAREAPPLIVEVDQDQTFPPPPDGCWIEDALAEHGVVLSGVANCVADAAVFAASRAIRKEGVQGKLGILEIDALHRVAKGIIVGMLRDMLMDRISKLKESPHFAENATRREILMPLTEDDRRLSQRPCRPRKKFKSGSPGSGPEGCLLDSRHVRDC